jgi:hypothetical protein
VKNEDNFHEKIKEKITAYYSVGGGSFPNR